MLQVYTRLLAYFFISYQVYIRFKQSCEESYRFSFSLEEECYACVTMMVQSKKTKFITQTKLHFETIWRTAMLLSRRHAVVNQRFLPGIQIKSFSF